MATSKSRSSTPVPVNLPREDKIDSQAREESSGQRHEAEKGCGRWNRKRREGVVENLLVSVERKRLSHGEAR